MRHHRNVFATGICIFMLSAVFMLTGGANACGSRIWYLPEGYTGENFDTYILVQNPNDHEGSAKLTFLTREGKAGVRELQLMPMSRTTVKVDDEPGLEDAEVSTIVETSGFGIVVERAMYFRYGEDRAGGSDSIGATRTSDRWFLAEGYTGGNFDTYILIMNPYEEKVRVRVKFMKPKASQEFACEEEEPEPEDPEPEPDYITREYDVEPMRRFTVHVDDIPGLEDTEVSAVVEVVGSECDADRYHYDHGVVAERAMYFDYNGMQGGHCAMGSPEGARTWYLPEGRTAGQYDTYVLVMNPYGWETDIKATFMLPCENGGLANRCEPEDTEDPPDPRDTEPEPDNVVVMRYRLEPYERFTIPVDGIPGLESTDFSTMVEASEPVVVERAMYFMVTGLKGEGHNSMGANLLYRSCLLPEGCTGGAFNTWILVQNPGREPLTIKATFMKPEGNPVVEEYEISPYSRFTIPVDEIPGLEDAEVSTRIDVLYDWDEEFNFIDDYGIVAERAMYFEYNGIAGGHSSIGFGEI